MRLLAAPDKFRGTATAAEVARAVAGVGVAHGWDSTALPLADGGEGTLDVLGGPNRSLVVAGPLGQPLKVPWRFDGHTAVIEMALASGLDVMGGPDENDPVRASTVGTGQLLAEAVRLGARKVIVAAGGSATTDGGAGCLEIVAPVLPGSGVELVVACDVRSHFTDAARLFGPQKGANRSEVLLLETRLHRLADRYESCFEVDVRSVPGAGAAGGLAGALLALGARLVSGFDLIARHVRLLEAISAADLVITGEGRIDAQSVEGKVVGGVMAMCHTSRIRGLALAGEVAEDVYIPAISLTERFGHDLARSDVLGCVAEVTAEAVEAASAGPG